MLSLLKGARKKGFGVAGSAMMWNWWVPPPPWTAVSCCLDWLDCLHTNVLLCTLTASWKGGHLSVPVACYSWLWCWYVALVYLGAGSWANCEVLCFFPTDEASGDAVQARCCVFYGLSGTAFMLCSPTHFISSGQTFMSLHWKSKDCWPIDAGSSPAPAWTCFRSVCQETMTFG